MNELTVYEVWTGTPMKMRKRYAWKVKFDVLDYSGEIHSKCVYESPEEAMEDYKKICQSDDFLHSVPINK